MTVNPYESPKSEDSYVESFEGWTATAKRAVSGIVLSILSLIGLLGGMSSDVFFNVEPPGWFAWFVLLTSVASLAVCGSALLFSDELRIQRLFGWTVLGAVVSFGLVVLFGIALYPY